MNKLFSSEKIDIIPILSNLYFNFTSPIELGPVIFLNLRIFYDDPFCFLIKNCDLKQCNLERQRTEVWTQGGKEIVMNGERGDGKASIMCKTDSQRNLLCDSGSLKPE